MSAPDLDADVAVDRFEAVGLDELNVLAALQTRVDRKYVLDRAAAERVLGLLDPSTRVLDVDGRRAAAYESVYFDTADLLSFRLAALGRRRRFKLRTRAYVDSSAAYLELKTRGQRSVTVKERIEHRFAERDRLDVDGRAYAAGALPALGLDAGIVDDLRPMLLTRYRRTTLLQQDGAGRATFDTHLAWQRDDGAELLLPHLAVVETKSGSRPSPVDRALWSAGVRPSTVSKYGTGLAALRPDLPSSRWSRVLRHHFDPDRRAAA